MNAVDVLNTAFATDPAAIRALVINRVPCNKALACDPLVQVEKDVNLQGEHFTVGALGLINAVLAANGSPLVACKWKIFDDGRPNQCLGFEVYKPIVR